MKRFIEKLYGRLYGRKFRTGFYSEVMTYNITVEIKDGRINGKLNKYIEIKNKNNMCLY